MIFGCEDQRDESWLWLDDFQIELAREIVAEGSGAELGDWKSPPVAMTRAGAWNSFDSVVTVKTFSEWLTSRL